MAKQTLTLEIDVPEDEGPVQLADWLQAAISAHFGGECFEIMETLDALAKVAACAVTAENDGARKVTAREAYFFLARFQAALAICMKGGGNDGRTKH